MKRVLGGTEILIPAVSVLRASPYVPQPWGPAKKESRLIENGKE